MCAGDSIVAAISCLEKLEMSEIRRLHWGCGASAAPGWVNSDILDGKGVDVVADITKGLPLESDSFDYAVSHHALVDLGIYDQVPALKELRRVLRPGGVLRLGLPDLDVLIAAYQRGNRDAFLIDDWDTLSGNFITHMLWYNITKTPFTYEFAEELLGKAGFREITRLKFGHTASGFAEIIELDTREDESFFVEAGK